MAAVVASMRYSVCGYYPQKRKFTINIFVGLPVGSVLIAAKAI